MSPVVGAVSYRDDIALNGIILIHHKGLEKFPADAHVVNVRVQMGAYDVHVGQGRGEGGISLGDGVSVRHVLNLLFRGAEDRCVFQFHLAQSRHAQIGEINADGLFACRQVKGANALVGSGVRLLALVFCHFSVYVQVEEIELLGRSLLFPVGKGNGGGVGDEFHILGRACPFLGHEDGFFIVIPLFFRKTVKETVPVANLRIYEAVQGLHPLFFGQNHSDSLLC